MTIEEYIKSKPKFDLMPFVTVYTTIMELLNDGFIEQNAFEKGGGENVAVHELKPQKKECRRLYHPGNWHSDR